MKRFLVMHTKTKHVPFKQWQVSDAGLLSAVCVLFRTVNLLFQMNTEWSLAPLNITSRCIIICHDACYQQSEGKAGISQKKRFFVGGLQMCAQ